MSIPGVFRKRLIASHTRGHQEVARSDRNYSPGVRAWLETKVIAVEFKSPHGVFFFSTEGDDSLMSSAGSCNVTVPFRRCPLTARAQTRESATAHHDAALSFALLGYLFFFFFFAVSTAHCPPSPPSRRHLIISSLSPPPVFLLLFGVNPSAGNNLRRNERKRQLS